MRTLPFAAPGEVEAALDAVRAHLEGGGVVAYPTETVYGFGTLLQPDALAALARLKRREPASPFLLLVRAAEDAAGLVWSAAAERLAVACWPGPLTLVLPDPEARYPEGVRSATGGVAVRATSHEGIRRLLAVLPGPLTSTSANPPGGPPARNAPAAAETVRDLGGEVLVLDGGASGTGPPSTIVDCTGPDAPRLLRAGAVSLERLRSIVETVHE
ncbi:MAG: L-threonylcarbamoyladenylate synthase [Gemmatimonadota bacterium]